MSDNGFGRRRFSARQRVVVLTFVTVDQAEAWDRAGQPIDMGRFIPEVDVAEEEEDRVACDECGRTDLPLFVDYRCPHCHPINEPS